MTYSEEVSNREAAQILRDLKERLDDLEGEQEGEGTVNIFRGATDTEISSDTAGLGDYALDFENTDQDFVDLGTGLNTTFNGGGEITICAFVRPESFPAGNPCVMVEDFQPSGSNVVFVIHYHATSDEWRTGFYDGSWHRVGNPVSQTTGDVIFLAGTYDGSNIRLYEDGTETASVAETNTLPAGDEKWTFGRRWDNHNTDSDHWDGAIDDVRIYDRALSASEIRTLSNGGHVSSNLVGHWKMSEGYGTTASDSAGSNDGTIDGAGWIPPLTAYRSSLIWDTDSWGFAEWS